MRIPFLGFGRMLSPWWWVKRVAALVVVIYLLSAAASVWLASDRDERREVQAIVVLGAAQYNGKPSPVLRSRLDHALALYRRGDAPIIIVTGGRQATDRTTEAAASANYLIRKGVPDANIRREVQGRDTYESLAASQRFLRREGVSTVLVVTDGYHAARARAVAREVGLLAYVSPVPTDSAQPLDRMLTESAAVAVGRLVGFRRVTQFTRGR